MSTSDEHIDHSQQAGGSQIFSNPQELCTSSAASSHINRHMKRRLHSLSGDCRDSELVAPSIATPKASKRCRKRSSIAAYKLPAYRPARNVVSEERDSDSASTNAPLARRVERVDEGNVSSCSVKSEGSTLPEWSCYEEQSVFPTPLRTLLPREDNETQTSAADCFRDDTEGAFDSTEVEIGVVVEGSSSLNNISIEISADAHHSKNALTHIECNAQEQAERYSSERSEELENADSEFDGDPNNRAEAVHIVGTNSGVEGASSSKTNTSLQQAAEDLNEASIERNDSPWRTEGIRAADFLKSPVPEPPKDEVGKAGSLLRSAASGKKRRRQKKVTGGRTPSMHYTLRCCSEKKRIRFKSVQVYYFERSQGFTAVPTSGGITLGMTAKHHDAKEYSIGEFETMMQKEQLERYRKRCDERAIRFAPLNEPPSSPSSTPFQQQHSADPVQTPHDGRELLMEITGEEEKCSSSYDQSGLTPSATSEASTDEEVLSEDEEDEEEFDGEDDEEEFETACYMMQPVGGRTRQAMLKAAGVRVDRSEAPICQSIRASRQHCGCTCADGVCTPQSCECANNGIKCQVDRPSFPCPCVGASCGNPEGRVEFNALRVRAHYLETMMRMRVLDGSAVDDPTHIYSPQHIRFEDSAHEASSYCNPPPPPLYQRELETVVVTDERMIADMEEGPSSHSQHPQERMPLPTTPVYDSYEHRQLHMSKEAMRRDSYDEVSVDVTVGLGIDEGFDAESAEQICDETVENIDERSYDSNLKQ
uniref:Cysteine/serine-rich nuclear protein N-terminal domain-containing protein n=1 Tax=Parascaris univalens TaxID=6257 RepID=A0A915AEW6_PARUN